MHKYQCNSEEVRTVLEYTLLIFFSSENVMNFVVQLFNFEIFKGIELPNNQLI